VEWQEKTSTSVHSLSYFDVKELRRAVTKFRHSVARRFSGLLSFDSTAGNIIARRAQAFRRLPCGLLDVAPMPE
jgi:hypothetical protein